MQQAGIDATLFGWLVADHPSATLLRGLVLVAQAPVYAVPVLLVLLWLFGRPAVRHAAVAAALTGLAALALAHLCSDLVVRPRPFTVGLAPNRLDHAADSSFPSDHATLFFALAGAFALDPARRLRWLGAVLAATGLAVGTARVALGVHFPLDVAGAAVIGGLTGLAATRPALATPVGWPARLGETVRGRVLHVFGAKGPLAGDDARPTR